MLCYSAPFPCTDVTVGSIANLQQDIFSNSWMTAFSDPNDWCECSHLKECVISAGHANMQWQGKVRFDGRWRGQKHREISSVPHVLSSWNSRKQGHARLPFRRKKRYLELAVVFVLVLKYWPFLWEALGGQRVHMWMLKAGTIFPSLPQLRMSYGIQLRPLKNKAIPSIAGLALSQSNCLRPVFQCSSITCLHVPSLFMTTG